MSHVIYTSIALFLIALFTISLGGTIVARYSLYIFYFNTSVTVNYNYEKINSTFYIVNVKEIGKIENTTLNVATESIGYYNYTISYNNDIIKITYYSSNYSKVYALIPVYLPFTINKSYATLDIKFINNSGKISSQILTPVNITRNGSYITLNYSDLNTTAIPVFYSSAIMKYHNGILTYYQANYSTIEHYEETTLMLDSVQSPLALPIGFYIGLAIILIALGVDIPLALEYRRKKEKRSR